MDPTISQPGIPGGFIALMVLFAFVGIGLSIWKFSLVKSNAKELGVSDDRATYLALTNPDQALASITTSQAVVDAMHRDDQEHEPGDTRTLDEKLAQLDAALTAGHITQAEHDSTKQRLLGEL
jgi:hypothetical protein